VALLGERTRPAEHSAPDCVAWIDADHPAFTSARRDAAPCDRMGGRWPSPRIDNAQGEAGPAAPSWSRIPARSPPAPGP